MNLPQSDRDAGVMAAAARGQTALANAGAAVATLTQAVADEMKRLREEYRESFAAVERREAEAERRMAAADAREQAAAKIIAEYETQVQQGRSLPDLQAAYRRGYNAGHHAASEGRPADAEKALNDKRNPLRVVA